MAAVSPSHQPRRRNARKTCLACRQRKARCELPNVNILPSNDPLPPLAACSRCTALELDCIVDGRPRKRRVTRYPTAPRSATDDTPGQSSGTHTTPAERPSRRAHNSPIAQLRRRRAASVPDDHSTGRPALVNLLHGFQPFPHPQPNPSTAPTRGHDDRTQAHIRNMKLHGRPLNLMAAMLGAAYGSTVSSVDLSELIDDGMRRRLEPGVVSLMSLHPWLPSLQTLFDLWTTERSDSTSLLLALVVYLASCSIPRSTFMLRKTLSRYISAWRDRVSAALPSSLSALQAMELLSSHAPLGALPWDSINYRTMLVAQGQVAGASAILVSADSPVPTPAPDGDVDRLWHSDATWLWLSLIMTEARIALEADEQYVSTPSRLAVAGALARRFVCQDLHYLWTMRTDEAGLARLLGKLSICDGLLRVELAHECLKRIRSALEALLWNPIYDMVSEIEQVFQYDEERQNSIAADYDAVAGKLPINPSLHRLTAGTETFRQVLSRYETSRILQAGWRALVTAAYIADAPSEFVGGDKTSDERLHFAMEQTLDPMRIVKFASGDDPALQLVVDTLQKRGDECERALVILAELHDILAVESVGQSEAERPIPVAPIIRVCGIGVESVKILMELRAGEVLFQRRSLKRALFRFPTWLFLMRKVSEVFIRSARMFEETVDGNDSEHEAGTVAAGCGRLIASMVRITEDWTRRLRAEQVDGQQSSMAPVAQPGLDPRESSSVSVQPSTSGTAIPFTLSSWSDREVAASAFEHSTQPPDFPSGILPSQQAATPGVLDFLISQMLNYPAA